MSKAASIVEINGTRYDAGNGAVIGSVKRFARQVKDQSNSRVIDGFVRRPASVALSVPVRAKNSATARGAKTIHRAAERSHTLMRGAVSRPGAKPAVQAVSAAQPTSEKKISEADPAAKELSSPRAVRARSIVKNARVRRFGEMRSSGEVSAASTAASASSTALATSPGAVGNLSHQRLERMLDRALFQADAHKNMLARSSKSPLRWIVRHWITSTIVFLVVLILAGVFVWQSMPAVSMDIAARRAGLSATLPAYVPDNYSITAPIDYSAGAINIHYANSINKSQTYTLSERKSNWDSASLPANALSKNTQVQTSEIGGTTVYTYGNNLDATWVNNGIWYTVYNNGRLSSDQLLRIAQNM